MGEWVLTAAIWLYYQCAYFMLNLAALFDLTYRDTNIAILFILWPAVTGLLLLWVGWNQIILCRLRRTQTTQPANQGK